MWNRVLRGWQQWQKVFTRLVLYLRRIQPTPARKTVGEKGALDRKRIRSNMLPSLVGGFFHGWIPSFIQFCKYSSLYIMRAIHYKGDVFMKIERTYVSETPCHIDGLRTFVYRWYDDSKSRYVETNIYKKGTKHIFQHNLPVKVQREIKRMIREGDFVRLQIAR